MVDRFNPHKCINYGSEIEAEFITDDDGCVVLYSDYAKLEAELESTKKQLTLQKANAGGCYEENQRLQDALWNYIEKAKAVNRYLEKENQTALEAVIIEIALDNGRKGEQALEKDER